MATTSPELIKATQRVKELFESTKIGVDPFEKAIGVSQGTIKNVKNGRNLVSADCIIKLAKYFNVSADYLLCLTDEPKPLENHEVAQTTTTLPAELGLSPDLFKDSNFIETAKLYNSVSVELRSVVFGIVLGAMQTLKVDTKKILGY